MTRNVIRDIPITVEHTGRRKTASIQVTNGRVRVLVPRHLPEKDVSALIDRKMGWIEKTLDVQAGLVPAVAREYVTGEVFTYLGRSYTLEITSDGDPEVKLKGGRLWVCMQSEPGGAGVRKALVGWYRSHALAVLQERTRRFATMLNVPPPSVTVKDYRSRWGSCSSDGRVTYNWRIIVAPSDIVDYVVVHELFHLVEPNHSRAYWRLVESAIPDYRDRRRWLRENGHLLDV